MGDVISTLFAEGIHCSDEQSLTEPFFLQQARKRIYVSTYRSDKTLSTFFGRPPMMSDRYSNRSQPLDLDDEVIACDDEEVVREAMTHLDANGWNTDGKIRPNSWIRLRWQMSVVKERFLELSLSGFKIDDIGQKIE
jgi:hypothetical protein